jgi:hypothetical protein
MNGVVYQGILSGTSVGSSPTAQIGVSLEMAYKKLDAKGCAFSPSSSLGTSFLCIFSAKYHRTLFFCNVVLCLPQPPLTEPISMRFLQPITRSSGHLSRRHGKPSSRNL